MCIAWIGCNALLGNESAVFDPDAAASSSGASGASGNPNIDGSSGGEDVKIPDGANPEAGPCVNKDTNARHCGACFHDCINGACVNSQCQPFVLAKDPGKLTALAVSATHVYWTNDDTGNLMRVPIAGGSPTLFFDGSPDAGLGSDIAVHQGHVYFSNDPGREDGGIARCPETPGCGGSPEAVVAHVDFPAALTFDGNSILFVEGVVGGRVGRCATPPCLVTFDVVGANERFPLRVGGAGAVVAWSTLLSAGGGLPPEVRVSIAGGPPVKAAESFAVYPVTIIGNEIVYAALSGPIRAVKIDGGVVRNVTPVTAQTDYLAVEGTVLYYADTVPTDGKVYRLDTAPGAADGGTVLATKQKRPRAIATDAVSVYWINQDDSEVMRLAK